MKKPPKCASLIGIGGVLLLVKSLSNKNGVIANLLICKSKNSTTNLILFFNFKNSFKMNISILSRNQS